MESQYFAENRAPCFFSDCFSVSIEGSLLLRKLVFNSAFWIYQKLGEEVL